MQGAMYHLGEGVARGYRLSMTSELLVFLSSEGLSFYFPEDDYLGERFVDDGVHMTFLSEGVFKGLLEFEVDRLNGHPILTDEQRRSFNEAGDEHDLINKGNALVLAFDDVVDLFMGSEEDAKKQALDWLVQQYDPEYANTLRGN